ncbi:MAG: DUF998 domain-containing protein [Calditrichaeota bacterium]|nr:MAG: DUF998 domain-containing protein [Calditrichota bacterium]
MKIFSQALLGLYLAILFIAGLIAPEYYSLIRNTVSELGAQGFPNAWLMRTGFFVLAGAVLTTAYNLGKKFNLNLFRAAALLFLLLYGGAVFITGFWSDKNFFVLDHNLESFIHSFLANIAGMFYLIAVWMNASSIKQKRFSIISFVVFFSYLALSYLFFEVEEFQGLTQRGMHLISASWLILLNEQQRTPDKINFDKSVRA